MKRTWWLSLIFAAVVYGSGSLDGSSWLSATDGSIRSKSILDTVHTPLSDYAWPTDASRIVTSTFAEYRRTHFHAGIDISTNNHTGYRVLAARDGYISRIRISPNGYGKMLYVTHADGYVTTYAHLSAFSDSIDAYARREQHRLEQYPLDVLLDSSRFRVTKGELIAFSGNTGVGGPHLHFEIRDEHLNPVNPLLFENMVVEDDRPPTIRSVALIPMDHASAVDGLGVTEIVKKLRRAGGANHFGEPITVTGRVGLAVDVRDLANGARHRVGVHRLELYLDGNLIYSARLDRLPSDNLKQILVYYDLPLLLRGAGRFQKLFAERNTALPFFQQLPYDAGIIDGDNLTEGEHAVRIVCRDFRGNAATIEGSLITSRQPRIEIKSVEKNTITVAVDPSTSAEQLIISGRRQSATAWDIQKLPLSHAVLSGGFFQLPWSSQRHHAVKIQVRNKWNVVSQPAIYASSSSSAENEDLRIEPEVFRDYVRINLHTSGVFTNMPEATVIDAGGTTTLQPEPMDINHYVSIYYPTAIEDGIRFIRCFAEINGGRITQSTQLRVYKIPQDKSGWLTYGRPDVQIVYDSAAVFRPLLVQIAEEQTDEGLAYRLLPQNVLLNQGVRVFIRQKNGDVHSNALYMRDNYDWEYRSSEYDSATGYFSAPITMTLPDVTLLEDRLSPAISALKIRAVGGRAFVSFRLSDDRSGIDAEEIKLYIDGDFAIPEIENAPWRVRYQSKQQLERGSHTLEIVVKDRMKNTTTLTRRFTTVR